MLQVVARTLCDTASRILERRALHRNDREPRHALGIQDHRSESLFYAFAGTLLHESTLGVPQVQLRPR